MSKPEPYTKQERDELEAEALAEPDTHWGDVVVRRLIATCDALEAPELECVVCGEQMPETIVPICSKPCVDKYEASP